MANEIFYKIINGEINHRDPHDDRLKNYNWVHVFDIQNQKIILDNFMMTNN
ncbi:putative orfan [Tupanvirus soda lake]|uniref:Orfan n=2 Tax=Tupanvirus TaxID=2094720 RepID=A0AC62ADI9_9VIRU|nr:putative orfan [Tupanvirus soda lake]QKU35748.1 putative orfan [Tupanvirus soda lake]